MLMDVIEEVFDLNISFFLLSAYVVINDTNFYFEQMTFQTNHNQIRCINKFNMNLPKKKTLLNDNFELAIATSKFKTSSSDSN